MLFVTTVSAAVTRVFSGIKAGITGCKGEAAVAHALSRLELPALHDVILADSLGLTQIDHIVLGRDAVVVIETKTYGGFITGNLRSRDWVQHLAGGGSHTAFQNPVRQNERHCLAVLEVLAGFAVPVRGYIVSAGKATFCDDLIGAVVPLDRLSDIFMVMDDDRADPMVLRAGWGRLVAAAGEAEPRREEHLEMMNRRRQMTVWGGS